MIALYTSAFCVLWLLLILSVKPVVLALTRAVHRAGVPWLPGVLFNACSVWAQIELWSRI